jgi:hypothetical protein
MQHSDFASGQALAAARSRRLGRTIAPWLAVSCAAGACAPKIHNFEALPNHICPGTSVKLDVQVTGNATVTNDRSLQPQPDGTYAPTETTRFSLKVSRSFRKKGSEAGVEVMPNPDEITVSVKCEGNLLRGSLVDRLPVAFDARLKVTTLETGADRELSITHEGREARISPEKPSTTVFDGTSPAGPWAVSAPLLPGEKCGSAPEPPHRFILSAGTRCGP